MDGAIRRVTRKDGGQAELEDANMLFRADKIEWNSETGDVHASGRVYFRSFDRNEELWCDRLDYNVEDKKGMFYEVRGITHPKISARPGLLTTTNPFYFQGKWAERDGLRYILHDGFVTNCRVPKPWWKMRGSRFVIEPGEKALAYRSVFLLKGVPVFYAPVFYHSLVEEPRKSGFLTPNVGTGGDKGYMVGAGYFWAINRSYDTTYRAQYYSKRGWGHNVELRGQPRAGTDFDAAFYAVQDRGKPSNGESYSGASLYVLATSDLHKGWTARAQVNYISSFRFRKEFTESYSEAVTSEVHSVGFVNKNWPWITLDVAASLLKNYQDEIKITDAETGEVSYLSNAITIRKIPEAQWSGRDRKLFRRLPLWYSFDASAGLLYRDEPLYSGSTLVNRLRTQAFMPRLHIAPHVTTAFHWHGIHLIPSFGIYETYYGQARVPHSDYFQVSGTDMVSSAREFTADLVLPSLARVYRRKTVFGDALKHVIEPRATYRYVTGVGEDFARFVRFDETEMLANTNEVELSLANRIYSKRGDSIQEIFSWQLWQKRYFDTTFGNALIPGQRNTFLSGLQITPYAFLAGGRSTSPVASVLRANPGLGFGTEWRADYDPRVRQVVNSSLNVDYRHDQFFASAAHNLVDTSAILGTKADQFRFTTGVGSSTRRGWNAGGTLIYNYHKRAAENANFQVTYNTDCCGVSFEYQRNFVNNTSPGVRFAFTVANFGSVGNLRQQDRMF